MTLERGLERAAWGLRSAAFGELRAYDDGRPIVAMTYAPPEPSAEWRPLRSRWLDLPPHPHILDALGEAEGGALLLRYAALHWEHPGARLADAPPERVAAWGAQLTDAYRAIWNDVPAAEAGRFLRPAVHIDLGGAVRLGFLPELEDIAPEARATWPRCDERAIVYAIGAAMRRWCEGLGALHEIVDRCMRPDPGGRYGSLDELEAAWRAAGGKDALRTHAAWWSLTEAGLGWLPLDRAGYAMALLQDAFRLAPYQPLSQEGLQRAVELQRSAGDEVVIATRSELTAAWWEADAVEVTQVLDDGRRLEDARAFREALALYLRVPTDAILDARIDTAIARCHLALGAGANAAFHAKRALDLDPRHTEAHALRVRGHLTTRAFADALAHAEAWLAVAAEDADGHYLRGRALFGLGRFVEAREAFARACALDPQKLEAAMLRREADRAIQRVRGEVGVQPALELDVSPHLPDVRDALARGSIELALELLARPAYQDDPAAVSVRARCLAFTKRFEEAVAAYDHLATLSTGHHREATLGKADALLALGCADEALALFDRVVAEAPRELAALEGRALALRQLGRDAEADDALGKVVAASGGRSDLRLGTVRS